MWICMVWLQAPPAGDWLVASSPVVSHWLSVSVLTAEEEFDDEATEDEEPEGEEEEEEGGASEASKEEAADRTLSELMLRLLSLP